MTDKNANARLAEVVAEVARRVEESPTDKELIARAVGFLREYAHELGKPPVTRETMTGDSVSQDPTAPPSTRCPACRREDYLKVDGNPFCSSCIEAGWAQAYQRGQESMSARLAETVALALYVGNRQTLAPETTLSDVIENWCLAPETYRHFWRAYARRLSAALRLLAVLVGDKSATG